MNKYVVTMNAGPRYNLTDNGRRSMMAAAERWGADYIELKTLDKPGHHYMSKIFYDQKLPDGRICWMDADVMIRSDCPSPFRVVPEGRFGLVRGHHPSHSGANDTVLRFLPSWMRKVGFKKSQYDINSEYPNTGFVVYDLPEHRKIFDKARDIARTDWNEQWWCADQGHVFAAYKKLGIKPVWIPVMFQHHGSDLWYGWTPYMDRLGYHFCGPINQWIAGDRTVWDDLGPNRLTPKGNTRWDVGKPNRFGDHHELPFYLREVCNALWHGKAVEVGCLWGGFTWYGARIAVDNFSEWTCVDPWKGGSSDLTEDWDWDDIYEGFKLNMRDAGLLDHINIKRMRSVDAAKDFEDNSLDLVFIDGDHSYECCKEDIEAWWPKLKKGGVMLGHDYGPKHPGVIKAVKEKFGDPEETSGEEGFPIWKKTK